MSVRDPSTRSTERASEVLPEAEVFHETAPRSALPNSV
jgi:hypothetical protein